MPDPALKKPMTLDEFLEWEERQPERWEYVDGIVRMMSGGTEDHDRISVSIIASLRQKLRGTPCSVHASNLKIVTRPGNASVYPELFVRCGGREGKRTKSEDPIVVFEVLSPSTMKYDLTRKRNRYKTISSLKRIVYLSQDEPRLDMVVRDADGRWSDDELEGLDAVLELPEIGVSLTMTEIYEDTDVARADAG